VDEQALTRPQVRLGEERVVRGGEDLGRAAGRRPVERLRNGHRLALMHGRELRLAAAADDRHHAVALLEAGRALAEAHDLARELQPGDVGGTARRRRIVPLALHHVGAVDARGSYRNEDLAPPRFGVRTVGYLQISVFDRYRSHGRRWYVPALF